MAIFWLNWPQKMKKKFWLSFMYGRVEAIIVNATVKAWLRFVFFFSLFQASGFDQSVIWNLVKSDFI